MKLIASMLCLTLALVQLSGCQKNTAFDPDSAASFFPLRPGLIWTYRVVDKGENTNETFTDRTMNGQARVGTITEATGRIVALHSGSDGSTDLTIRYVVEDGYITRSLGVGDGRHIISRERQFLPRLLTPGLTWSNSLLPLGNSIKAFHITQTHRTSLEAGVVLVPAGHFSNCIRIDTEAVYQDDSAHNVGDRRLRYVDWYAPNVGLIKTVVLESGFFGVEIGRVELIRFGDSRS